MREQSLLTRVGLSVAKGVLCVAVVCGGACAKEAIAPPVLRADEASERVDMPDAGATDPWVRVTCALGGEAHVVDGTLYAPDEVKLDVRIAGEGVDVGSTFIHGVTLADLVEPREDGTSEWSVEEDQGSPTYAGMVQLAEGRHDMAQVIRVRDEGGALIPVELRYEDQVVQTVVVDTTAPQVTLCGVSQGAYLRAPATVEVTVRDATLGVAAQRDADYMLLRLTREGVVVKTIPLGWDEASTADEEHVYSLEVPASTSHEDDGAYVVEVVAIDAVGNSSAPMSRGFMVDTMSPELSVSFEEDEAVSEEKHLFRRERTAHIRLVEKSFDVEGLTAATEPVHMAIAARDGRMVSDVKVGPWSRVEGTDVFLCDVTFPPNGTYELTVSGADRAANALVGDEQTEVREGTYASGTFVIDDEPPHVTLSYAPGTPAPHILADVDYFRAPVVVEVCVRDRNPEPEHMSVTDTDGNEVVPSWAVTERDEEGMIACRATVCYEEGATAEKRPRVQAQDQARNAGEGTMSPFVVDQTPPRVVRAGMSREASKVGRQPGAGGPTLFYSAGDGKAPTLTLDVSDAYGLDAAWVTDPTAVYSRQMSVGRGLHASRLAIPLREPVAEGLDGTAEFTEGARLLVRDVAGNVVVWTMGDDAETPLDGQEPHPRALVYDATPPLVDVSGAQPGSYRNDAVVIHVAVDERNIDYLRRYDPNRVVAVIRRRDDMDGGVASVASVSVSQLEQTFDAYGFDQQLMADGHYEVEACLADYAGNASTVAYIPAFTVDTTAPRLWVSWNNTNARNGKYYSQPRTATLTIVEHNFDANLVSIQTTGVVGPWAHVGDTHLCQVTFESDSTTDAPHTLSVQATDRAGNRAEPLQEQDFVIDTHPPVVSFWKRTSAGDDRIADGGLTELNDHTAFSGALEPRVLMTDEEGLDASTMVVSLGGKRSGGHAPAFEEHRTFMSEREAEFWWDDLGLVTDAGMARYELEADDVYTLTAQVCDRAGNQSHEERVTFSVNRFGSTFYVERMGALTGDDLVLQTQPLLTEAPLIEVHEVNVSGAAQEDEAPGGGGARIVTKEHARATKSIPLVQGGGTSGYDLITSTEPSELNPYEGWTESTYLIRPGNFGLGSDSDYGDGGQGVYHVSIGSQDAAHNNNTTMSFWGSSPDRAGDVERCEADIAFTLDEQGPRIEDLSLPDQLAWAHSFEATFRVEDKITEGDRVDVRVDGEPVEVRWADTGEPLSGGGSMPHDGTLAFTVTGTSVFTARSIDIQVADYTGLEERTAKVHKEGFRVSTLAVEGGVLLALLVCTATVVHMRKRGVARGVSRKRGM